MLVPTLVHGLPRSLLTPAPPHPTRTMTTHSTTHTPATQTPQHEFGHFTCVGTSSAGEQDHKARASLVTHHSSLITHRLFGGSLCKSSPPRPLVWCMYGVGGPKAVSGYQRWYIVLSDENEWVGSDENEWVGSDENEWVGSERLTLLTACSSTAMQDACAFVLAMSAGVIPSSSAAMTSAPSSIRARTIST